MIVFVNFFFTNLPIEILEYLVTRESACDYSPLGCASPEEVEGTDVKKGRAAASRRRLRYSLPFLEATL